MILELVDMISEPFGLPEWSMKVAFFILLAGLVMTAVISWIYEIRSKGEFVKTEPANEVQDESTLNSTNGWRIASYMSFMVIVGLIVINIIPRSGNKKILDKSIAVLPFYNDSPESENTFIINGYMTAVHNNLCRINDLRVLTLQSTEQFRSQSKSIPEIAKELGVGYLLSARGQILNNKIRLTVQLVSAKDEILWSNPYDRQISQVDDHIEIQSDIAQLVAGRLEATITPEVIKRIENVPTSNLVAYELYQKAMEEQWNYWRDNNNLDALNKAENLYRLSLDYDSAFALSYAGLGRVYMNKHYWLDYFNRDFMDSVLILANTALRFNSQLSDAYTLRGQYYMLNGRNDEAIRELDQAIDYNPNSSLAYMLKGNLYLNNNNLESIKNFNNAISRSPGKELPLIYKRLAVAYNSAGFLEKQLGCLENAFYIDRDTTQYYFALCAHEFGQNNCDAAIKYGEMVLERDSTHISCLRHLGDSYANLGEYKKALRCYEKMIATLEESGDLNINSMHRVGYIYWLNEMTDKADRYFKLQIDYCDKLNELERGLNTIYWTYYDLAAVYSFTGETEKAIENLRILNEKQNISYFIVWLLKWDPLLEKVRDNPEFKQIARDLEAKYLAEHARISKWLEENGLLLN
jgi:TolB-like protein/lipopolysaccharide biosynthesis regulator YciM